MTGDALPSPFVSELPARTALPTNRFFEIVQSCELNKVSIEHVNPSASGRSTYPTWVRWKCKAESGIERILSARLLTDGSRVMIHDVGLFSMPKTGADG
jgi:hypothetical protein